MRLGEFNLPDPAGAGERNLAPVGGRSWTLPVPDTPVAVFACAHPQLPWEKTSRQSPPRALTSSRQSARCGRLRWPAKHVRGDVKSAPVSRACLGEAAAGTNPPVHVVNSVVCGVTSDRWPGEKRKW